MSEMNNEFEQLLEESLVTIHNAAISLASTLEKLLKKATR